VRFLDHREPGTSLALFRIAAGLVVVGAVGSVVLHGLVPTIWLDRAHGGFIDELNSNWLFEAIGGPTPAKVWAMVFLTLGSGALLALGLGGRLTALVAQQSYFALTRLNPECASGDDRLLINALWLLVLARSTATLSLDCRLRTGNWRSAEPVPAWPRYIAIAQLVLLYWAAGTQKAGYGWMPGGDFSALYYICQQPFWTRWDLGWLAWVYPLTQVATAGTWLFECSAPLLLVALWCRATADRGGRLRALFNRIHYRAVFVAAGLALHGGLFVMLDVEPFTFATLSFYACLFRPEEWQKLPWLAPPQAQAPAPTPGGGWWPQARAALVALHLFAVVAAAFPGPSPSAANRVKWKNEPTQMQMAAWSARLGTTPEEFEDALFGVTRVWLRVREAVLWPFRPYYDYCGTWQAWALFAAGGRDATRLHVEVREGGEWRTVYVTRDPKRAWLDGWLSHHRMRSAVEGVGNDEQLPSFAAWIAEQAAKDFPEADAVRVRYHRARSPTPREARSGYRPEGRFIAEAQAPLR
jgi:hypothetical protein